MANGSRYDPNAYTCASRTWPLGTRLHVCNRLNGRCTIVLVTDRGPYYRHRVIDLSRRAAQTLGFVTAGTAPVIIQEEAR